MHIHNYTLFSGISGLALETIFRSFPSVQSTFGALDSPTLSRQMQPAWLPKPDAFIGRASRFIAIDWHVGVAQHSRARLGVRLWFHRTKVPFQCLFLSHNHVSCFPLEVEATSDWCHSFSFCASSTRKEMQVMQAPWIRLILPMQRCIGQVGVFSFFQGIGVW